MSGHILRHILGTAILTALACPGAASPRVELGADLARPLLVTGAPVTTHLKVGLTGLPSRGHRTPANVAIVLDRSGSMQGEKIEHARRAAVAAVDRLTAEDIVAVLAYDHEVTVLVPATRLTDRAAVRNAIMALQPGGYTALFAGVSHAAAEVRKFLDDRHVNRIVLLSDGLANVGPDSPAELGSLGSALKQEGISVTSIGLGLGYNEDLMSQLAWRSDGNHAFVEHPRDLARVFDHELGDVLSVVAQNVTIRIDCPPGVRPVRVLGREAEVRGQTVLVTVNQLYAEQEKYALVELEIAAAGAGETRAVADVQVDYADMATGAIDQLRETVTVAFTDDHALASGRENRDVMIAVVEQVSTEQSMLAVALRDQGRISEAQQVLLDNAAFVASNASQLQSQELEELARSNETDAQRLSAEEWERNRKQMRATQEKLKQQRKW
jgi:Ca-activated chloride channel family protein